MHCACMRCGISTVWPLQLFQRARRWDRCSLPSAPSPLSSQRHGSKASGLASATITNWIPAAQPLFSCPESRRACSNVGIRTPCLYAHPERSPRGLTSLLVSWRSSGLCVACPHAHAFAPNRWGSLFSWPRSLSAMPSGRRTVRPGRRPPRIKHRQHGLRAT